MTSELVMGVDMASGDDICAYTIARKNPDRTMTIIECGRLQRRVVRSPARKRKLRKRGETVMWDMELGAWTWHMRRPFQ